jgi:enoyl-CoA hydratase
MTSIDKVKIKDQGQAPSLSLAGEVATITFNRPEVHNRFQAEDLIRIRGFIEEINANLSVRILIFTGTGPTFSSGFDLREFQGKEILPVHSFEALTDAVENARPITIARVQGPVYGGATDLVLACDFRVAVEHTEMFMPAAQIGLHYYANGIRRWQSRLGINVAKRLFLTAEKINALEMLRIGFVDEVVNASLLDACVSARVQRLLTMAPQALENTKRSLNESARGEFNYATINARHTACVTSGDMAEALKARAEKRTPKFNRT